MPSLCSRCTLDYATPGTVWCTGCHEHARQRRRRNVWSRTNRQPYRVFTVEEQRKANARSAANRAQAHGVLVPKPCERCGDIHAQKHHSDYNQPLVVSWLCDLCHRWTHAEATA